MMRQLRQNTKWIMLITALAFVGLMVFEWGMDMTGRTSTQMSGGEVGRVNGQAISYEEFYNAYRSLYDQQQQAMGGQPIGTALNRQIEDAAFEQLVMQRLLAQELRRRGIETTPSEIRQAARVMPPQEFMTNEMFLTDGVFDLAKYHQYLSSPMVDPQLLIELERYYREAIPRTKLFLQTTAGTYVTDGELWRMWRDERDAVRVRFLEFDPAELVPEEGITVSDAEVAAYYRQNRESFRRPARARVKYVWLDRTPTAADTAAALDRARAIRAELLDGADFAEVARRESADSVSARDGGRVEVRRGEMVQAFEEAAFAQPVGRIGEPVATPFGFHIIRVDRRTADEAEVRHILVPVELTRENENALLDRADQLDVLVERMQLDEIGREMGLEVHEAELIPGFSFLPGLGQAEDGEDWAFREGAVGEVSPVFETPRAFYAFELLEHEPERILSQQEADQTIRAAIRADKRRERARERVRELVDRIRAGQSLDAVAEAAGTTVREAGPFTRADFVPGLGQLSPAVGAAFGLRPGQTSGVVESNNRLYVIQVVERIDADRAAWEQQKQAQREQVTRAMAEQRWNRYLAALRESADVVDGRDQLLGRAAAQRRS
jgi:peptidyl-prolyl cis-trans isomerase D